jgi:hypothetical protein
MIKSKQLLMSVMIIAIFIFIVSFASLYTQRHISCGSTQTCTIPIPFLIPISASLGLFIGTLVYYLMVGRLKQKNTDIHKYHQIISKLLEKEERDVLKIIAKEKEISQAKVTSIVNMPRVKVFRIIKKLQEKNLVEKKEQGKKRIIKIKEELSDIL